MSEDRSIKEVPILKKPRKRYAEPVIDPDTGLQVTQTGPRRGKLAAPKGSLDTSGGASERQRVKRILELKVLNTPMELISSATDTPVHKIQSIIKEFSNVLGYLEELPDFRRAQKDLIDASMYPVLKSISNSEKLEAASLAQSAIAFKILHTASRLEHDKSTSNNANATFIGDGKSLKDL